MPKTRDELIQAPMTRDEFVSKEGINRPGLISQKRKESFVDARVDQEIRIDLIREELQEITDVLNGFTDERGRIKSGYFTDERGRLKIPYGQMDEHADYNAAATSLSLTTEDQYFGWTTASDHASYGEPYVFFEGNGTADRLVIGSDGAGIWGVCFTFSVHSGGAAIQLSGAVHINDTIDDSLHVHRYLSGTNDMGSASALSFEALEAGDYLDLRFSARNANSRSIDIHHMSLSVWRVNHKR